MATQEQVRSISLEASADLSASQFCFVMVDANGQVALPSAGGDAIGVLQDKPSAIGRAAEVAIGGRVKVVAGAVLAAGAPVQSDAAGNAIVPALSDYVLGTTLTAAAAIGDLVEVLLGSHYVTLAT